MFGLFGLVLLGYGIVTGFLVGGFVNEIVIGHLVLGALGVVVWFVTQGASSIGSATQVIKGRRTRFGTAVILYGAVFLGIVVTANWLVMRYNKRWDLTEQGVYSLSPQSRSILAALPAQLELVGFKGVSEDDQKIEELLRLFKNENPGKISSQVVDPRSRPHLIEQYEMKQGNLIFLSFGSGETKAVSRINEATEEALTNAVLKLTRGAAKKVYFVQGHGQPSIESAQPDGLNQLAAALKDEHLNVETLLLSQAGSVPADAASVVLVAPRKDMLPEERKILIDYVNAGGRLLMLADPRTTDDVRAIADAFGITVRSDVVLDQVQRLFAGPAIGAQPIAMQYDTLSPITKNLSKENVTIYNIASSVAKRGDGIDGAEYRDLVKTSASAWGETNLAALFDGPEPAAQKEGGDTAGPVTLAVSYEKKLEGANDSGEPKFERVGRLVVFGDSDWVLNANLRVYSNRDLFLNAVNWLAGEEGGVTIRAGTIRASYAPISGPTFTAILLMSFLIPELILLFGVWVWWRRRSQALAA